MNAIIKAIEWGGNQWYNFVWLLSIVFGIGAITGAIRELRRTDGLDESPNRAGSKE